MRERRSKVCPINGSVPGRFGGVEVFTATTVELDGFLVRYVSEADRKEGLLGAEHAWAAAKIGSFVLFQLLDLDFLFLGFEGRSRRKGNQLWIESGLQKKSDGWRLSHHFLEPSCCYYPSGMDETIK